MTDAPVSGPKGLGESLGVPVEAYPQMSMPERLHITGSWLLDALQR